MTLPGMEQQQLALFRDSAEDGSAALFPESNEVIAILEAVYDSRIWVDNSGKGDPPPDFLCPSGHLMVEVMGVDDHAHRGEKKLINPYKKRESKLKQELIESGILEEFRNAQELFVNPVTNLPGREDHCYAFYLEEFKRVLGKHKNQAAAYHANHPGNKLIFFVFDDSSGAYFRVADGSPVPDAVAAGQAIKGKPHNFWADVAFQEAIYACGADYLIWYTPWKYLWDDQGKQIPFPKACVYDLSRHVAPALDYPADRMVSSEP